MRAKYENDTEIAKAKRDYELKKAAYDIEVHTKVCKAIFCCCCCCCCCFWYSSTGVHEIWLMVLIVINSHREPPLPNAPS